MTGPASSPRFVPFTTAQGLSSSATRAIAEDRAGRIYIGHGRGIDGLDPESGRVRRFTSADGVPPAARAALRDRHGALWFTTRSGVLRLVPDMDPPAAPPPLLITKKAVMRAASPPDS